MRQKTLREQLKWLHISADVEEDLVGDVINRIGENNVVISTDYPHADSHWPDAVNHFMAMECQAARGKRSCGNNCARLYAVD